MLNEHMTLHRNNSLVEGKSPPQTKSKSMPVASASSSSTSSSPSHSSVAAITRSQAKYTCKMCNRRLSTLQSLQQHTMIHNNEKPHVCPYCKKDFRHLSNYKMHIQKHEEEDEEEAVAAADGTEQELLSSSSSSSRIRSADFGRLVGPLFVKESLLGKKDKEPVIIQKYQRSGGGYAKENLLSSKGGRRADGGSDYTDDVIPLKTFNNVDNIVMNATKLIVRLDNLDANMLKKRIKTPDISIDRTMVDSRQLGKKHRIPLPSSDRIKKLKLDQIENIIMDDPPMLADDYDENDDTYYDSSQAMDADYEPTERERPLSLPPSQQRKPETLTDNELLELLNDGMEKSSPVRLRRLPLPPSPQQPPPKSNVILLKSTPSPAAVAAAADPYTIRRSSPAKKAAATVKPLGHHSSFSEFMAERNREKQLNATTAKAAEESLTTADEPETTEEQQEFEKCDTFDTAFSDVALRRLMLIRRKADQNGGKVENKYLLGPLFWRKALHRAQRNTFRREDQTSKLRKCNRLESRRTNDPAKLQQRAETKMRFMLNRVKMMSDVSDVNLAGPLFWKRTLKLAGVRNAQDLKTFVGNSNGVSLDSVEFVECER